MTDFGSHFYQEEFKCRCDRVNCDAPEMDQDFIDKLRALRLEYGKPLSVTSGARCDYWNKKVGGTSFSQHKYGRAADIFSTSPYFLADLLELALKHHFTGIGIGKNFIHLDTRPGRLTVFGY